MTSEATTVAAVKETLPGEHRVALVPEAVSRLTKAGLTVLVEAGAGEGSYFPDSSYTDAGATVVSTEDLYRRADVLLMVNPPDDKAVSRMRDGQLVLGLLRPLTSPELIRTLAGKKVDAASLDLLPRTLSRAQEMDALTSQANAAGYKAVLIAAARYPGYFPLLMTAAGTSRPAEVLILGAGVAGLQAIGTAKRLGAVVRAYDVRSESRGAVESLGAGWLELEGVAEGTGEGGYARQLTEEEQAAQRAALAKAIGKHHVVVTTAQVPGRRPPLLVTAEALTQMRPGSVVVDVAASALGGNVEGSKPGETIVTDNGVTIIGAENLPAGLPTASSTAYARNISAVLNLMRQDNRIVIDTEDEIQSAIVVAHGGAVVNPALNGGGNSGGGTAASTASTTTVQPEASASQAAPAATAARETGGAS